ncbi:MAG: phosphoribosylglycinamide formyltransferase [Deltaproteobacteria bacterium]|nr:phosphoribosylglycinamide formyltransferase [Deltaproteobacteria bacterium]
MVRIGVLISGSGSNLQSIIDAVKAGNIAGEIVLVVSNVEEAYGLTRAANHGINTRVVRHDGFAERSGFDQELVRILLESHVELVVLAGFMRVLGKTFLNAFAQRVINIHPALLPAFPGTHGQAQALAYGVKLAGCTVHFVDEEVDHGPIIMQAVVPVLSSDSEQTLAARILRCEHKIFPRVLALYCTGRLEVRERRVFIRGDDEVGQEDIFLISGPADLNPE